MTKTNRAALEILGLPGLVCALALLGPAPAQAQTATEAVLYSFEDKGSQPIAGVISDPAGNLYGTAYYGGAGDRGVLYKLDTGGQYTILHSFLGGSDGARPYAGVVRDAAGNLYGTTVYGGPANMGVVYKVDPAGNETVLHRFSGGADGCQPYAGLFLDPAGNLYGTTYYGGAGGSCSLGCGVVFMMNAAGEFQVLHSFAGADGENPHASVTLDPAGNIYGTTYEGGPGGGGVVYKLEAGGQLTVLYGFTGGADGGQPAGGVIHDADGNLYGTTFGGGAEYYAARRTR